METFMYTFHVEAEEPLLKTKKPICSPEFKTTFSGVHFYCKVKFATNYNKNNDRASLTLYIGNLSAEHGFRFPTEIRVQFVIIRNLNDISFVTNQFCSHKEIVMDDGPEIAMFVCKEMITNEAIMNSDKSVKVICKLCIAHKEFNYYNKDVANVKQRLELCKMLSDKLFDQAIGIQPSDGLCDVVLKSFDGNSFFCHKMLLACSSDVFNTMFARFDTPINPENVKQNLVEIDDIDGETLTEILRFIYKSEVGANVDNLLGKCLYAAEKYDLPYLKSKCLAKLKFNLMPDNVLDSLELADTFSSDSLKMGCFEIFRLFKPIIDPSKLENFASDHASLYDEMISFVYKPVDFNLVL